MSGKDPTPAESHIKDVQLDGFDNFSKFFDGLKPTSLPTYFYFSGKKESGRSWCPDCVECEYYLVM